MQRDAEQQQQWMKKGKKYKAKYLSALGELFGNSKPDSGSDICQKRDLNGVEGSISENLYPK